MKLLITTSEYNSHQWLFNCTGNPSTQTINNTQCVYCDITSPNTFAQNENQLDSNSYAKGDGNLLPKEAL